MSLIPPLPIPPDRDQGGVRVLGVVPDRDRVKLKSRIGIVLQSTAVERYLTVRETIAMTTTSSPRPRPADEVIHLVDLDEKLSRLTQPVFSQFVLVHSDR